jgi:hypothetical protein
MAGTEQRQQVIDGGTDLAQIALEMGEGRRADRDHHVVARGGIGGTLGELEPAAAVHPIEQVLRTGLVEGHSAGPQRVEQRAIVIYSEDLDAAVGE